LGNDVSINEAYLLFSLFYYLKFVIFRQDVTDTTQETLASTSSI